MPQSSNYELESFFRIFKDLQTQKCNWCLKRCRTHSKKSVQKIILLNSMSASQDFGKQEDCQKYIQSLVDRNLIFESSPNHYDLYGS